MPTVQKELLIPLQAMLCELPAIDTAARTYIRMLEMGIESSEEKPALIGLLRSFQQRYQELLRLFQTTTEQEHPRSRLVVVQATPYELLAFGTAMLGYIRLLKLTVRPCALRDEVINHLLRFQKRYLDSIPQRKGLAMPHYQV